MVDWNDNKKRKEFREALLDVYRTEAELRIFVDDELDESLAKVAVGGDLTEITYKLVVWAKAQGRLDDLYNAFKRNHKKHPAIEKLERSSFVSQTYNLTQNDWDDLFGQFLLDDLADLQRAFRCGFKQALRLEFQQAQPKHPPLIELTQIRELLEVYDAGDKGSVLAVRFVECAIAEIQRSSEGSGRDLTGLQQWRDRIAQRFNVSAVVPEPSNPTGYAYLLITLEGGSDINGYAELRITGTEAPIPFAAEKKDGPISEVVDWISEWIPQAEKALIDEIGVHPDVILEVFLPCKYLGEDIATTWMVQDEEGDEICLGAHRWVLVRSSDRIRNPKIRTMLKQTWERLKNCEKGQNACAQFHIQENCPEGKEMYGVLQDAKAIGLKLLAKLPNDFGERTALLKGIIKAAIPIALWPSEMADADVNILKTEFDSLLAQIDLTDFADLARQWRSRRRNSASAKHIRLLCDRPDRLPNPPDPNREEDLLVAS